MVMIMQVNLKLLPLKLSRENPNAINADENTAPIVETMLIKRVFEEGCKTYTCKSFPTFRIILKSENLGD